MGWLLLALIGMAVAAALWLAGIARGLWSSIGAALMLGAAGYAWQQHATLSGHPVTADATPIDIDPGMVAFREAVMPGLAGDDRTLVEVDAQLRAGNTDAAAQRLIEAIARRPADAALWTGLGSTLAWHDGGQVSPAAQFAFRRAMRLAPDQPGPPFFLGLAHAQTGDLAAAKLAWLRALTLTPRAAPYRVDIAERLAMVDQFEAMLAARQGAR